MTRTGTTTHSPLHTLGWSMVALTPVFAVGMWLDPRLVDGAPVWLKPMKFALSIGVFAVTLHWMLRYLHDWPRLARVVERTTVAAFVVEMVAITLQASRGTASHFNVSTPFDGTVFGLMATFIAVQTLATLAVVVALWRQPFADRSLGWAMRIGLAISVVGAMTGGLMTRPTAEQLNGARSMGVMTRVGGHTVGAADGGPGLPGTGWSRHHGDLRVPHFLGLHAMQALPLFAVLLARRRARVAGARQAALAARDTRVVVGAAVSYASLLAVVLAQALSGQSVTTPEGLLRWTLVVWAVASATGIPAMLWRAVGAQGGEHHSRPSMETA